MVDQAERELVQAFGQMVRARRRAQKLRQDDLALIAGVGVRFIHDLENGKPSCQLGKALLVGRTLGIKVAAKTSGNNPLPQDQAP